MALQNLFGDLALDTTAQDTNTLLTQLAELTQAIHTLVARQNSQMPALVSPSGMSLIDLAFTRSNLATSPLYVADMGTYSPQDNITYSNINEMVAQSTANAATAIYSHIQVI